MFQGYDGQPLVYLGLYGFIWCLFSCGCAVGVVLGVGFLLYYQVEIFTGAQCKLNYKNVFVLCHYVL